MIALTASATIIADKKSVVVKPGSKFLIHSAQPSWIA